MPTSAALSGAQALHGTDVQRSDLLPVVHVDDVSLVSGVQLCVGFSQPWCLCSGTASRCLVKALGTFRAAARKVKAVDPFWVLAVAEVAPFRSAMGTIQQDQVLDNHPRQG